MYCKQHETKSSAYSTACSVNRFSVDVHRVCMVVGNGTLSYRPLVVGDCGCREYLHHLAAHLCCPPERSDILAAN